MIAKGANPRGPPRPPCEGLNSPLGMSLPAEWHAPHFHVLPSIMSEAVAVRARTLARAIEKGVGLWPREIDKSIIFFEKKINFLLLEWALCPELRAPQMCHEVTARNGEAARPLNADAGSPPPRHSHISVKPRKHNAAALYLASPGVFIKHLSMLQD